MNRSLKKFASRILVVHAGLLAVLLTVVFAASHEVYRTAHRQAVQQAQTQQQLLANQTASGLKGYYDSIFDDLALFKPIDPDDEEHADERTPQAQSVEILPAQGPPPQGGRRPPFRGPLPRRMFTLTEVLPWQLNGRVSHLFIVRKDGSYFAQELGKQATSVSAQQIVDRNHEWIDGLDKPTLVSLQQIGTGDDVRGFSLIGVPLSGASRNSVLVATVPVRQTAKRFFDQVNQAGDNSVFLLDEKMAIMAASKTDRVGGSVDARAASEVAKLSESGEGKSEVVSQPFTMGIRTFGPSIITVYPVKVLDKQWDVALVQPMEDVDAVVGPLFWKAVFWAIFVALSMTAILVSSAVQLIRNRARMERERHELLEKELRQAREIQLHWLPRPRAKDGVLDIATINQPASRISGDFYNWFDLSSGRTAVVIGDVTGHGMAAAFLMATTQLLVRNTLPATEDPGRCLEEINRQLCTQVFNGQFVTLQVLVFDPNSATVEIATAGHPGPLLDEGTGFRSLELEPNLVLGVEKDSTYPTETFALSGPATLLLYTDGVIEAESPDEIDFGLEGLRRSLDGHRGDAQQLVAAVVKSIDAFRHGRPIRDDLTMVAIQLQPQWTQKRAQEKLTSGQPLQSSTA